MRVNLEMRNHARKHQIWPLLKLCHQHVPLSDSVTRTIPLHQRARSSLNCYPVNAGLEQSEFRPERSEPCDLAPAKGMKLWRLRFGRDI